MEEMGRSRDQIKIMIERCKTMASWMVVGVGEEGYQAGGILENKKESGIRGTGIIVRV